MKKYPVISESGNAYMAKVHYGRYNQLCISLYVKKKMPFGLTRFKRVFESGLLFMLTSHARSDYVGMIEYAVKQHEESEDARILQDITTSRNADRFAEWDGNCKDGD